MTSVLKKSRGTKGKSESMQEDLPARWGNISRANKIEDVATLIKCIDDNIIGKGNSYCGPYGRRKGNSKELKYNNKDQLIIIFIYLSLMGHAWLYF